MANLRLQITQAWRRDQVDIQCLSVVAFVVGIGLGNIMSQYVRAAIVLSMLIVVVAMRNSLRVWAILSLCLALGVLHMHWHKCWRYAWGVVERPYNAKGAFDIESQQNYGNRCRLVGRMHDRKLQSWVPASVCKNRGRFLYMRGRVYPLRKNKESGFSLREHLRWQGIQGQLQVRYIYKITHAPSTLRGRLMERAQRLARNDSLLTGVYLRLLLAQGSLSSEVRRSFSAAGIAHVLAISGLHMSMLSGFVLVTLLSGFLMWGWPWYARYFMAGAVVVSLTIVWGYAIMCWGSLTALRATITSTFMVASYLLRSQLCPIWTSFSGVMVILLCWPESLFRPGFQMSALCVIAIAGIVRRRLGFPRREKPSLQEFSLKTLAGLGMSIRLSALTSVYATQIPGGGVLGLGLIANLVVIPLMGLVVMPVLFVDAGCAIMGVSTPWIWDFIIIKALYLLIKLATAFASLNQIICVDLTGISWVSYLAVAMGVCWCALMRSRVYL